MNVLQMKREGSMKLRGSSPSVAYLEGNKQYDL